MERPPPDFGIPVGERFVRVTSAMRYLGVYLDSKMSFVEYCRVDDKTGSVSRALGRLMSNLRGPDEHKRRLYANVLDNFVWYPNLG